MCAVERPQAKCDVTRGIYLHFAEGSDEQRQFKVQAARDWDNFLFYRSKELVPGMVLALVTAPQC